ncbi:MAG: ABC transporter ATP-binding protein [Desulfobacteraceae bacterium]
MLAVEEAYVGYYKDINILQGVWIKAEGAQITSIIGPNGVGKSTLLKAIYGFLRPNKGKILYEGKDITGMDPYTASKKGLAYIPQRRNVFPYLSVEENMEMGAWTFRRDKARIKQRLEENYQRFPNLEAMRRRKAAFLSGGEQRMVELGRALMADPQLLLVDEPTAGLAPMFAKEIRIKLVDLKEESKAIILVEQNIREAIGVADYVYVLDLGRNKVEGSQEQFATDLKDLVKDWLF